MCEMNQPDTRLSAALRRLGVIAPRSAPPALGEMLKNEFRRHHLCRRKARNASILLAAACLATSVGVFFILRPRPTETLAAHDSLPTAPLPPVDISVGLPEPKTTPLRSVKSHGSKRTRKNPESVDDRFMALPTFDPAIPIDHSEIVRVDLPGRALRLVGFPVGEEFADRRVLADVVLAQDGTPYALRLVQNSLMKEK
jgi:hypothetical protein